VNGSSRCSPGAPTPTNARYGCRGCGRRLLRVPTAVSARYGEDGARRRVLRGFRLRS
jgi:hypothetical protein